MMHLWSISSRTSAAGTYISMLNPQEKKDNSLLKAGTGYAKGRIINER